ncbi:hypothetical protein [Orrella marina]|uniref:Uncharacterized protein n=1 Tax=Orrella marina TaxID=2163011 RepID=A0A2R4XFF4_9BURK|nr:hypothetical protein [Orrella marina]AWB32535.1 hypothetical protein DBV39_01045 [Orrella marina]
MRITPIAAQEAPIQKHDWKGAGRRRTSFRLAAAPRTIAHAALKNEGADKGKREDVCDIRATVVRPERRRLSRTGSGHTIRKRDDSQ